MPENDLHLQIGDEVEFIIKLESGPLESTKTTKFVVKNIERTKTSGSYKIQFNDEHGNHKFEIVVFETNDDIFTMLNDEHRVELELSWSPVLRTYV